jgi:putative transposase
MTQKQDSIPAELLDQLLANCKNPKDFLGENGFIKQLTKAFVERALQAELSDHLGHNKNELVKNESGNTRNGRSNKRLTGDFGELEVSMLARTEN